MMITNTPIRPSLKSKYHLKGISFELIPFTSGDGFQCNLIRARGKTEPTKGPIILVHGAGVSASIFMAPVKQNVVEFLVENGYDVWMENWRASIDFLPNQWTLDQAGLYDHPYAVKKIIEVTGVKNLKAIIHCQGSTSFMISLVAGLVPEVTNVISNAVSLHPVVAKFSEFVLD